MRGARFALAMGVVAMSSGCGLLGFDLSDYGGDDPNGDGAAADSGDATTDGLAEGSQADGLGGDEGSDTGGDGTTTGDAGDAGRDALGDAPNDTSVDTGTDTGTDASFPPCSFTATKRVFVSSARFTGASLASLTNADMQCNNLALAAGLLEPSFKAWLSDEVTSATSRLAHAPAGTAYTLMDKTTVVACTWNELASAPHRHAIDRDEKGTAAPTAPGCGGASALAVWTGTAADGTTLAGKTCTSWASGSGSGTMGLAQSTDVAWTSGCGATACSGNGAIYCVEQ
jgi:hypothetical protein